MTTIKETIIEEGILEMKEETFQEANLTETTHIHKIGITIGKLFIT